MTKDMQKVKDLLLLRKCSDRAVSKYLSCINKFKNYYKRKMFYSLKLGFPKIISKQDFIKMFNSEFNLKHKLWILLAYGSGLIISEVASLKVSYILSKEHKIRVIGKGNKERYAPLPDFTLNLLRLYWIQNKDKINNNYFFPGKY